MPFSLGNYSPFWRVQIYKAFTNSPNINWLFFIYFLVKIVSMSNRRFTRAFIPIKTR
jgi:hypothetical protein